MRDGARITDRQRIGVCTTPDGAKIAYSTAGRGPPGCEGPDEPQFPDLTPREREILRLVARGLANADIARDLGLREKTVRNYVSIIIDKLGVDGRPQAIVEAREAGLR